MNFTFCSHQRRDAAHQPKHDIPLKWPWNDLIAAKKDTKFQNCASFRQWIFDSNRIRAYSSDKQKVVNELSFSTWFFFSIRRLLGRCAWPPNFGRNWNPHADWSEQIRHLPFERVRFLLDACHIIMLRTESPFNWFWCHHKRLKQKLYSHFSELTRIDLNNFRQCRMCHRQLMDITSAAFQWNHFYVYVRLIV